MPSLLLLPGNMCDARLWQAVQTRLEAAGLNCTVGDLSRQDTITSMALQMLAANAGPLIPIGFSMGAIVALEMLRQARERIVALALIAFNATADLPERAAVRPRQQAEVGAGHLARVVANELKPHYLSSAHANDDALRALTMDMAMALGPATFVRQSEALRTRADLRTVLPTIAVPTLLACGSDDLLCPPDWHVTWASAIGAHATLSIVPDAGHLLPIEQPAALADLLIGWLQTRQDRT